MQISPKLKLIQGDITQLNVDAIVNAANKSLLGGGGVDGAIHCAAGKELQDECRTLNGCETGEAKITKGYKLLAKFVIHTVGPIWGNGSKNERKLLENCYLNSLELAVKYKLKTIAFPNISTGLYRFPKQLAAEIAVDTVNAFLSKDNTLESVVFVCFEEDNYKLYETILKN
jgi:O-acetyl-ADP-ribose deacetylase (regulator of RNase III)